MNKKLFWIVNIIMIGCALVWTFTNVSYDEQYQMAMAYRLLAGDKMITQMWEPHQTSAFVCAAFMGLYHLVTKSYTGVAVFLHLIGMLIRAAVAVCFYRTVKKDIGNSVAYFASILVFMISPKDLAIPEFANVQVWMGILMFCSLIEYFRKQKKTMLIAAAACLCLQILAYPSCLIVYIPAVIILAKYADRKKRAAVIALFTGVCAIIGVGYISYFLVTRTPSDVMTNISAMMNLEPSHTVSAGTKLYAYLKDIGEMLICYAGIGAVGGIATAIAYAGAKKKMNNDKSKLKNYAIGIFLLSTAIVMLVGFCLNIVLVTDRCAYTVIFVYIIVAGLLTRKSLSVSERVVYYSGFWIGVVGFAATLMLTNLPFTASGAYAILAIAVSVIPICRWLEQSMMTRLKKAIYICGMSFAALLVVRCIYIRTPLTGRDQICSVISEDMSLVRSGPLKGIITNDSGARKQQICVAEFAQYVPDGSSIWIVDELTDSAFYMLGDYDVAVPSTIADPKNTEGMKKYWELNPDKMPDVIAVACYGGEIDYGILTNSWILEWIENEYKPSESIDGTFYRFLYK
ncbi:MAG: glucosyltransferase domain-containing protein [Lachnospiraceae bacterium]|nr:glucosyltransferase domain-containing protein [Lachnospiraceae bacterium]